MDFAFTPEQDVLREKIRLWAERELKPHVWTWENSDTLPWEAVRAMGKGGVLGFMLPKRVGGGEHGFIDFAIVLEELGRIGGGLWAFAYFSNLYGCLIEDDAFLRDLCTGQNVVAFAETEPQSGGDAAAIKTTATKDGSDYIINGGKHLISLIPGANWIIVTAITNSAAGGKGGMSMFLIEADRPGVKTTAIHEPGMKSHMLGRVGLKNVVVPESRLVGQKDRGFYQMRGRWDFTRSLGPTASIGNAMAAIELTVEWAKRKRTFGKPLLKWQYIQFKLVDALTKLEAARLLAYKGAWLADNKKRVTAHASMCRLLVGSVTESLHRDTLEIVGGRTYDENHELWKRFASCLAPRLWGGGDGIEHIILGTELFGREYASHRE